MVLEQQRQRHLSGPGAFVLLVDGAACAKAEGRPHTDSVISHRQPVGVGYSYAEKSDKGVWTTEAAAKDVGGDGAYEAHKPTSLSGTAAEIDSALIPLSQIHALLQIWFNAFDKDFGSNPFHSRWTEDSGRLPNDAH